MSQFDEHTFLVWQRTIRLNAAFDRQAPCITAGLFDQTKVERESRRPRRSSTPDIAAPAHVTPSILAEDWFSQAQDGVTNVNDEVMVPDTKDWRVRQTAYALEAAVTTDDRVRVAWRTVQRFGSRVGYAVFYAAERCAWLTEMELELAEASVAETQTPTRLPSDEEARALVELEPPVSTKCGAGEYLAQQLGQARVDVEVLIEQVMAATGKSRAEVMPKYELVGCVWVLEGGDAQVRRAMAHGVALREAHNYRRRCAALGWSTYKRIAFKRRYGTYERANEKLRELVRRRNRSMFVDKHVHVDGLVATRIRRRYRLDAGGRGMRAAA